SHVIGGFSGGPTLNDSGEVVGVTFAGTLDHTTGHAVPVSKLRELINREGEPDYSGFLPLLKSTERVPMSKSEQKRWESVYAAAKPSIFKVRAVSKDGTVQHGTAFVVGEEGYFV